MASRSRPKDHQSKSGTDRQVTGPVVDDVALVEAEDAAFVPEGSVVLEDLVRGITKGLRVVSDDASQVPLNSKGLQGLAERIN